MRCSPACAAIAFISAIAFGAADSTALLRDGARIVIIDVSSAGVAIPAESGRPARVLPLSLVRSVDGPLATKFDENLATANDLWRAGSRLKRRDPAGADAILEKLWKSTEGTSGPSRAEIAAGLLACRTWRGASASAVRPWAEWIDQSLSLDTENSLRVRSMIENLEPGDIWLASMPPVWIDSPAVRELGATGMTKDAKRDAGHPCGADVLEIYSTAARRDTGQSWGIDPAAVLKDPGWMNIAGEMVLAESDNAAVRSESRQKLMSRLSADAPGWRQSWIRLGVGRSLLHEEGADERRTGVLNLLWVASRQDGDAGIAATALADAARGLMLLGDAQGALAILADLERRFPEDPILESAQVASVRKAAGPLRVPAKAPASTQPATPATGPASNQPSQENPK